jgi:hypothetical protein
MDTFLGIAYFLQNLLVLSRYVLIERNFSFFLSSCTPIRNLEGVGYLCAACRTPFGFTLTDKCLVCFVLALEMNLRADGISRFNAGCSIFPRLSEAFIA